MQDLMLEAIKLEHHRSELSRRGDFEGLRKTYNSVYEIPNLNTSKVWSRLNRGEVNYGGNPMANDKIYVVSKEVMGDDLRVLDIGFGSGIIEERIHSKKICSELWGIDIAKKSVDTLMRRYKKVGWKFTNGDISEIGLPCSYFDYVLALDVLEHIPPSKTLGVLKKIRGTLKKQGKFILSVPVNEGLEEMLLSGNNPNAHTRIYSSSLIKAEIRIAGMKVTKLYSLYAFHKHYYVKSLICKLFPGLKNPNIIISIAQRV